ncbi:hypothetical protein ACE6H2_020111 [Prunus campanulata]
MLKKYYHIVSRSLFILFYKFYSNVTLIARSSSSYHENNTPPKDAMWTVFQQGNALGRLIPPFAQGTKDRTSVIATFSAANSFVGAPVAHGIDADRARRSSRAHLPLMALGVF